MITLKREKEQWKFTRGFITLPDGFVIPTLERHWDNNRVGVSCIPEDIYEFKRDHHGKHQWWSILDVIGRTAIEIHEGYKPSDSEGCILMSKSSLEKMLEFFDGDETYILEITS